MAFRSSAQSTTTGNASSGTVPVPSGAAINDIAIVVVSVDALGPETFTWDTGFTQLYNTSIAAPDGHTFGAAWKRLTAADTGNYSQSWTDTKDYLIQCFLFSGRDTTNPPVASTIATNTSSNPTPITVTANGVTAVTGDDLLFVMCPDIVLNNNGISFTPASTFTEQTDTVNAGSGGIGWCNLSCDYKENVSGGATGSISGTFITNSQNAGWLAGLIRIPSVVAAVDPVKSNTNYPVPRDVEYPMSGRTAIGMPMQQQVVPLPQLMGQQVM